MSWPVLFQSEQRFLDSRSDDAKGATGRAIGATKKSIEPARNRSRRSWRIWAEQRIIGHFRDHWQGPAVRIIVEDRSYQLGNGNARVEVLLHNPELLRKLCLSPELTFGEAYMTGQLEVRGSLKSLMHAVHVTKPEKLSPWHRRLIQLFFGLSKAISIPRAAANARHHYDIGSDFYKLWLDPTLTYSCAYFLQQNDDLATAQLQKLELLCRKARLAPGQTLLDIGCGWGALLIYAAKNYGVRTTGVTPSEDQANYIEALAHKLQLHDRVRVIRSDWRAVTGRFDRVISAGMFEHVGAKRYREFFAHWHTLLADGGLSILHTIGRMKAGSFDPWIDKYIFPDGYLPTLTTILHHAEQNNLVVLDVENLRQHYAKTLEHWVSNYVDATDQVRAQKGEQFARMWSLYLHASEAAFRFGDLQLWQIVLAKDYKHIWPLNREVNAVRTWIINRHPPAQLQIRRMHDGQRMETAIGKSAAAHDVHLPRFVKPEAEDQTMRFH